MWLSDLFSSKRSERFVALLRQQAETLVQAASAFQEYVERGGSELSDKIDKLEKQGDGIIAQLTDALRDTFVTPLDRQDIYNLGEAIDDMIDYLNNAAREIMLFQVDPTPQMREISRILAEAATEINTAVASLQSDPQKAWDCAHHAQKAENDVEDCYRKALAELFEDKDVPKVFKLREVYRHLSNSADRAEAVGRLIGKIVVKAT